MAHSSVERLNDKWLRLVGIPVSVPLATLSQMPFYYPGRWDVYWKVVACSFAVTVLIWEVGRKMLLAVRRRFPRLEDTLRRILLTVFGWAILVAVFQFILLWSIDKLAFAPFQALTWAGFRNSALISLAFWMIPGGVYEAIYFFSNYKTALRHTESLKKQQAQQRLDALKTRVNPHFLFNSLTTLSALINEDAPRAERFLDELSKVYRYFLRAGRQPSMSLDGELDFAHSYAFLLENRFEKGQFSILFENDGNVSASEVERNLPALTFQNALDYLVRTQNLPLKIEVKIFQDRIRINCDNRPKILAFDTPDNDWQYLENYGGQQLVQNDRLILEIPVVQNTSPL